MTTSAAPPSTLRRLLESGAIIAVAVVVMNVSTYGFQIVAARWVGPAEYGSIASLLAIQLVVSVIALGLQTTAARRIAAHPEAAAEVEHSILGLGWRISIIASLVLAAVSPLVMHLLQLNSVFPALLVAVGALPMNVMGAQAGVLQGERRWGALALVYLAAGIPRVVLGMIALSIRPTEGAAMAAVAVGWMAPCVLAAWFLRRIRPSRASTGEHVAKRGLAVEVGHASLALLGFYALSNVDIVMSRHLLTPHGSGLYAGGLILTKAVLFLPQFVSVVAFPAMSTPAERRRVMLRALALVAVVGTVCVIGSIVLADIAMVFVGGDEYAPIRGHLWQFAFLGMFLSALQLLIYSVLARQSRRSSWLIWGSVLIVTVVGWTQISSMIELLTLMTIVDAGLFVLIFGSTLWTMRADSNSSAAGEKSVSGVVPTAAGADADVERHA